MNSKVRARFAYYQTMIDEPPQPSYLILYSDRPSLPLHSNVSGEQLLEERVGLPLTPTYKTWVENGSPVFRG